MLHILKTWHSEGESVTNFASVTQKTKPKPLQRNKLKKRHLHEVSISSFYQFCDSAGIQTRNLLIRSQMLYSVELRSHFLIASAKVWLYFLTTKFFRDFLIFICNLRTNMALTYITSSQNIKLTYRHYNDILPYLMIVLFL